MKIHSIRSEMIHTISSEVVTSSDYNHGEVRTGLYYFILYPSAVIELFIIHLYLPIALKLIKELHLLLEFLSGSISNSICKAYRIK